MEGEANEAEEGGAGWERLPQVSQLPGSYLASLPKSYVQAPLSQ